MNQLIAIAIFLLLTAADTALGVFVSCVKLKQPFSLQTFVHQFEAQGWLLLAQLGGLLAQGTAATGTIGSTALVSLVYGAAAAGSANLVKDILSKIVALLESAPASSAAPPATPPSA